MSSLEVVEVSKSLSIVDAQPIGLFNANHLSKKKAIKDSIITAHRSFGFNLDNRSFYGFDIHGGYE